MNLEDIKMLRELHQLQQAGIITSDDFNLKKNEVLNSQKPVSSDEKIKLLQELHQLTQDGIISQEEFNTKKQELLNSTSSSNPIAVAQTQEKSEQNDGARQSSFDSTSMFRSGIEKTLHELNIDGLNMKLTNEKLYVNSTGSNETFALRSLNGVGIVDLVERYNNDLSNYNQAIKKPWIGIVISGFIGLICLYWALPETTLDGRTSWDGEDQFFTLVGVICSGIAFYLYSKNNNLVPPKMASVVRVMLSGGSRDFEFDKKSSKAPEVAKFVALVEDTLTAYHKNN